MTLPVEIGNTRRWIDCIFWRLMLVFVIGPILQITAGWLAGAHMSSMALVYALCCVNALIFGLLCWGESPARCRRRIANWVLGS